MLRMGRGPFERTLFRAILVACDLIKSTHPDADPTAERPMEGSEHLELDQAQSNKT